MCLDAARASPPGRCSGAVTPGGRELSGWNGKTEPCRDEEMERLASRFRDLGWEMPLSEIGHDFASVEGDLRRFPLAGTRKDGTAVFSFLFFFGARCILRRSGVLFLRTRYGKGVSAEENRDVAI
jgi:hypothetical protein